MRSFDVTAAALALGVDTKWIDNVLSHHRLAGVAQGRQGIRRRLQPRAVTVLALALLLTDSMRLPLARALEIAHEAVLTRAPVNVGVILRLEVDIARLEREISRRLAAAAEAAPLVRRGRPPARRRH